MTDLTMQDLSEIRDAVPHLDLVSIRALRRAGYDIVPCTPEPAPATARPSWNRIPRPMTTASLRALGAR